MSDVLVALMSGAIAAAISGAFGLWIQRQARRADQVKAREQIEAGAFDRARSIYDAALERAKAEIDTLTRKIADTETQVTRLEGELASERNERRNAVETARAEITTLRLELREREATIAVLRRVMVRKNLLPPDMAEHEEGGGDAADEPG